MTTFCTRRHKKAPPYARLIGGRHWGGGACADGGDQRDPCVYADEPRNRRPEQGPSHHVVRERCVLVDQIGRRAVAPAIRTTPAATREPRGVWRPRTTYNRGDARAFAGALHARGVTYLPTDTR